MANDRYTRWAVIAAGEGGGRIAVEYFTRNDSYDDNPGIEDRVLILNTNRADMRNAIDTIEASLSDADADAAGTSGDGIDTVEPSSGDASRYAVPFGPLDGVGNDFEQGEMCAEEGFDRIANRIDASGIDVAQAFLYVATLGGGTGNGTVPYLIHRLKTDPPSRAFENPNIGHIAFAAWPYDHDGPQQHHNAVCGLSRLLRWYDGSQNADMVLLASNSHVAETFDGESNGAGAGGRRGGGVRSGDRNELVNGWMRTVVDFMIGAGRDATRVIDTQDYISQPSRIDEYHFTPAISMRNESYMELSLMFDRAAERTFVPMDPATSEAIYALVRAPRADIERGAYEQHRVSGAISDWLEANGCEDVRHRNQTAIPHDRADGTVDVLLLFGGFDLLPLLEGSLDDFEAHFETSTGGGAESRNSYLDAGEYRRIRTNLEEYVDHDL